jgi:hypothetical protein
MRLLVLCLVPWLVACKSADGDDGRPTRTDAVCASPDPLVLGYTRDDTPGCTGTDAQCNFGKTFMDAYCINCHGSAIPRSQRNGAPLYHDFDTLLGVLEVVDHIDEQAGAGPSAHNAFMPGDGTGGRCPSVAGGSLDGPCPAISDQEREDLAVWLACERERPHTF